MTTQELEIEIKRLEAVLRKLERQRLIVVGLDEWVKHTTDRAQEELAAAKDALITEMMKEKVK